MTLHESIERKLRDGLEPTHLSVVNESHMHNVAPGSETHFRVFVVADAFDGRSLVERHRMIYGLLESERADGVHALGIQTLSPAEHEAATTPVVESPPCAGGDAS